MNQRPTLPMPGALALPLVAFGLLSAIGAVPVMAFAVAALLTAVLGAGRSVAVRTVLGAVCFGAMLLCLRAEVSDPGEQELLRQLAAMNLLAGLGRWIDAVVMPRARTGFWGCALAASLATAALSVAIAAQGARGWNPQAAAIAVALIGTAALILREFRSPEIWRTLGSSVGGGVMAAGLAGIIVGSVDLPRLGSESASAPIASMIMGLAGSRATHDLTIGRRRSAIILGWVCVLLALASLVWVAISPEPVVEPKRVALAGRIVADGPAWVMPPALAFMLLVLTTAMLVTTTAAKHRLGWTVGWLCGLCLMLIGALGLFGWVAGFSARLLSSAPPLTLLGSVGLASIAIGIMQAGSSALRFHRSHTVWLPTLAAALVSAATVVAWRDASKQDAALRHESEQLVLEKLVDSVREGVIQRVEALARMEAMLDDGHIGEKTLHFQSHGDAFLDDFAGTLSIRLIDSEYRVVTSVHGHPSDDLATVASADIDPAHRPVFEQVQRTNRAALLGPIEVDASGAAGFRIIVPGTHDGAVTWLVATHRYQDFLSDVLTGIAPEFYVSIEAEDRAVYEQGAGIESKPGADGRSAQVEVLRSNWTVTVRSLSSVRRATSSLPTTILTAGLLLAALLAAALRLAGIARERAIDAEVSRNEATAAASAQVAAQKALAESRAEASQVLDSMSDAVFTLDGERRFLFLNARARHLFAHDGNSAVGTPVDRYLPATPGSELDRALSAPRTCDEPSEFSCYSPQLGRWLAGRVRAGAEGLNVLLQDVTHARRAEVFEREQREILRGIALGQPLDATLTRLVAVYDEMHPGAMCSVVLRDSDRRHLRAGAAPRLPAALLAMIDGLEVGSHSGPFGIAMHRAERVVVADIANDPLWEEYRSIANDFGLAACWSQPFASREGMSLGSLIVYHSDPRVPSSRDLSDLETLAAIAGIAVESSQAHRRLEQSEQRFRSLFEHQPDAVLAVDSEGVISAANESSVAIFGCPHQQLIGASHLHSIDAQDHSVARANFERALSGEIRQYEACFMRQDGELRRLALTNLPIKVENVIVGVYSVARDVTEQRLIEARLIERDRFFSLSPLVFTIDSGSGYLTHVNDALPKLLGYSRAELLERPISEFIADEDLERTLRATHDLGPGGTLSAFVNRYRRSDGSLCWLEWNVLRAEDGVLFASARDVTAQIVSQRSEALMRRTIEGSPAVLWRWNAGDGWPVAFVTDNVRQWGYQPSDFGVDGLRFLDIVHPDDRLQYERQARECIARHEERFEHVYRVLRSDGQIAWVDERTTVVRGDDGKTECWQGLTLDVTARESARSALLERDQFFEFSPDLFAITSGNGYYTQVNRAFTQLLGWTSEEVCSRPIISFVHPDDIESAIAARRRLELEREPVDGLALRYVCRDGSARLILWNGRTAGHDRFLVSGRDITEERRAQEQERVLHRIIEESPAVMWRWRVLPQHAVELVSENVRRWGYAPDDFISGRLVFESLIHPDDVERVTRWAQLAHDPSCDRFHDTYRLRTATGEWIWVDERTTIVRGSDGAPVFLQGITLDVTAAQRAREEERQLFATLENGPAVLWRFDPYGDPPTERVTANVARWGYTPDDFVRGRIRFDDIVHPNDYRVVVEEGRQRIVAGESRFVREFRLQRADGGWVWVEEHIEVIRDATGAVEYCFALSFDVTEQRQAREKERQLHTVIELSPAVLWRFDLSQPVPTRLVSANVAAWGYVPEDFTSGRLLFDDLIHPDDLPRVLNESRPAIAAGAREIQLEFRFRTADGRWVWLDERVTVIRDSSGRMIDCISLTLDITPQRQAIAALHERDQFYALSLEIFAVADSAARFRQVNEALSRVLGFPPAQIVGQPILDYVHPDDMARALDAKRALNRGERVDMVEIRCRHSDGGWRWLEWNAAAGAGGLIYCAARDVTQHRQVAAELQRALRDLERRNVELQDFAFVASHDLQEPLRKVQAFSDRLISRYADRLDDAGVDYLRRMDAAAGRMQNLIDDLLAYSRVSTRGESFRPVELDRILREVISDLDARLESSGGEIDSGPLPTVDADPTQMRQLLQNLLGNALKFVLPGREPRVVVRSEPAEVGSAEVRRPGWRIIVEDNGIGFDPTQAERIFAPFQRLHGRSEYEGTGMGLAIVRKIAERHGGFVRAVATPGRGAAFTVEIPSSQQRLSGHETNTTGGTAGIV